MPLTVEPAVSTADFDAFADLVTDYVNWCRERYKDDVWFVDQALSHQSLDAELRDLARKYSLPHGRAFIARADGVVCGCGAYRWIGTDIVEMKRLFVHAGFAGKGFGRELCRALMTAAKQDGCRFMRLDTARKLHEAIALYTSLGFRQIAPYNDYPPELMEHIIFLERALDE
ncbi:MAG: GNAT family N-acetyltransferase [Labrys sp. (in: a-proteobacteria)]|jgi:GNAT superfamily N-acetyltransferase